MPAAKYKKGTEGKLLSQSRVDTRSLYHLGVRRPRWLAEHRRLVVALREMSALLGARRRGPSKPLRGRRLSRTLPFILERLRRGGDYLPPYRTVTDLALMCQDWGWERHALALERAAEWIDSKRGGKPRLRAAERPRAESHGFVLDDFDPEIEDALLYDPAQRQHDAMIAHIRLNRDPEELEAAKLFEREELRDTIRHVRDMLDLSRPEMSKQYGLSRETWLRMETLERKGGYLPHRSTLLKLAALCREKGWEDHALALEKAAGWERPHRYPERRKPG